MRRLITILVLLIVSHLGNAQNGEVLVCKGTSSYAYHKYQCQGLDQCRGKIVRMSVENAIKIGRTLCGYCYDAHIKSSSSSTPTTNGQCLAITKKGTQCSRKAKSNGYCWQHGGG